MPLETEASIESYSARVWNECEVLCKVNPAGMLDILVDWSV